MVKTVLIETVVGFVSSVLGFLVAALAFPQPFFESHFTLAVSCMTLAPPLFCVGSFALLEGCTLGYRGISFRGLFSGFMVFELGIWLMLSNSPPKGRWPSAFAQRLVGLGAALLLAFLASVVNRMLASRKKAAQTPADP